MNAVWPGGKQKQKKKGRENVNEHLTPLFLDH